MKLISAIVMVTDEWPAQDGGPILTTPPSVSIPSYDTGAIITGVPAIFAARGAGNLLQVNRWVVGGIAQPAGVTTYEILDTDHNKSLIWESRCAESAGTRPGTRIAAVSCGLANNPEGGVVFIILPDSVLDGDTVIGE